MNLKGVLISTCILLGLAAVSLIAYAAILFIHPNFGFDLDSFRTLYAGLARQPY